MQGNNVYMYANSAMWGEDREDVQVSGYKEVQVRWPRASEFCCRASGFYPSLAQRASKNSWKSYLQEHFWASENDSGLVKPSGKLENWTSLYPEVS